jgi:rieske iron-sulfur protein
MANDRCCGCARPRRSILKATFSGLCWVAMFPAAALGQSDPASMPPQPDDVLVRLNDQTLKPLTLSDIPGDAKFVSAWPMAPANQVVRSGNRLNELLLVRMDPSTIPGGGDVDGAGGVFAFSALCTHAGCNVATWIPQNGILSCDCHASDFDARARGKAIAGPATRPLPALPLKLSGDVLVVAAAFAGSIRFDE